MITIQATYNVVTTTWEVVQTENVSLDNQIKISVVSNTEKTNITGIKFGYTVKNTSELIEEKKYPQIGTTYELTDASPLVSTNISLEYDQSYTFGAWVDFKNIVKDVAFNFTIARPAAPHVGWIWDGRMWAAPIAAPQDGKYYNWSESEQKWKVITPSWANDYEG